MSEFKSHHPIRRETAKMQVLEAIREAGGSATFERLEQAIQGFDGSLWLHEQHVNCVVWKLEHNHAVAISELISSGAIRLEATVKTDYMTDKMATYVEDGVPVAMPVATRPDVYSEPHWLPSKLILEIKEF